MAFTSVIGASLAIAGVTIQVPPQSRTLSNVKLFVTVAGSIIAFPPPFVEFVRVARAWRAPTHETSPDLERPTQIELGIIQQPEPSMSRISMQSSQEVDVAYGEAI
ncbi:hypothetical protein K439DRAFT_1613693 [Ramaria rubella]|nr:hypothetical protein K439DRAFT_1613693 [Ramaria rubella]